MKYTLYKEEDTLSESKRGLGLFESNKISEVLEFVQDYVAWFEMEKRSLYCIEQIEPGWNIVRFRIFYEGRSMKEIGTKSFQTVEQMKDEDKSFWEHKNKKP
jgi:hypothetical protein